MVGLSLTAAALAVACGSDNEARPEPDCPDGALCQPEGFPFVEAIYADTNASGPGRPAAAPGETSASLASPESGKICMSGRVESGYAFLSFGFVVPVDDGLGDPFDASALGITEIRFTLDSPPQSGAYVGLVSISAPCDPFDDGCLHWGFHLHAGEPPAPVAIGQSRTVTAPLADFRRAPWVDPSWELDHGQIAALEVGLGAYGEVTTNYDFCVRDLEFLDANGDVVLPP